MSVTHEDVLAAAERIRGHVLRTPVLEIAPGVALKLEQLQHSGSFKVRGAFNRILSATLPEAGVIAASGGNHGLAVAYAARALGVRAEIFVPEVTSPVKVAGLRALGAEITQTGAIYAEAAEAAAKRAAETGALEVHAYDQPEVVAGQGTLGPELLEQTGGADTVLVAVGGGGLASGIALGVTGSGTRLVVVEPERIPTLHAALAAGRPVPVEVSGVAADALGASRVGEIAYRILSGAGVRSVLVSDEAIVAARRTLWAQHRIAAEHSGAAAFAALLSGAYVPEQGERVAVVICGANTDPATLSSG
ncbi:threonine/serine dehydratase [Thermoactinospora rubra]|uniref:threonine/serine dehydratase n=1 Tax=Thermoactinospora rubra TaxID=1088767 RepID=UPI000A0F8657|nr:threonine/serine dehydratase [Thermoactinospora rubra]